MLYHADSIIKSSKKFAIFNQVIIAMRVIINDIKIVIITGPKTVHFDLPKDVGNKLKQEISSS